MPAASRDDTSLHHVTFGEDATGQRLDRALAIALPALSRSRLQALAAEGAVTLNGATVTSLAIRVRGGDSATVREPPPTPAAPIPQPMALVIVHEDRDVIVIDKPAGLVVHPAAGHAEGTLVHALLAHCGDSLSGVGGVRRPGIVHRLDKDTSGLLVVAKNDHAHRALQEQFADHGRTGPLERCYTAVVWGVPEPQRGTIDAPLNRDRHHRERMAVVRDGAGRRAITHYALRESFGIPPVAALVTCRLETGRTHQIRVHMASRGHPLLGDRTYGTGFRTKVAKLTEPARSVAAAFPRQALHAAVLGFAHPRDGRALHFESPLPPDLDALVRALRGMGGVTAA